MKLNRLLWVGAVIGAQFISPDLLADDTNTVDIIKQLQQRLEELEQKVKTLEASQRTGDQAGDTQATQRVQELDQQVRTLERNRELDQEAAAGKAKSLPTVSLGANGLVIRSADSNFLMNVHGYAQADARFYVNSPNAALDTFLLRRVRPIIEGTVYDRFDYRLMFDFGSGNASGSSSGNVALLDDAFVNARLWPDLQVQIGKYKSPVGLERLQSTSELLFVETGFATQLTPNYDVGVMVHNNLFNTPINYAIGVFNGAPDGGSDDQDVNDEGKDLVGRLFFQPFLKTDHDALQKLGFGIAGSIGNHAGPLPSYKTPGQQTFFSYTNGVSANGQQYRIDPQLYYYWGPFGVIGEYVLSSQKVKSTVSGTAASARFDHTASQIEATWFLTGDDNSFRSSSRRTFTPRHNFSLGGGGWGAFELVGRVQQMSLDNDAFPGYATSTSASEATAWGVGLNWYLNSNVRLYLDYESTKFRGGSKTAGSVTADDEQVILGQVQFNF